MNDTDLKIIPYTATSLSVVGRFIFMFLLYRNKSTNSLSLIFCILHLCTSKTPTKSADLSDKGNSYHALEKCKGVSICSSSMWIYYSIKVNDIPMIVRSSFEITLLSLSSIYIIRNKILEYKIQKLVLPV